MTLIRILERGQKSPTLPIYLSKRRVITSGETHLSRPLTVSPFLPKIPVAESVPVTPQSISGSLTTIESEVEELHGNKAMAAGF